MHNNRFSAIALILCMFVVNWFQLFLIKKGLNYIKYMYIDMYKIYCTLVFSVLRKSEWAERHDLKSRFLLFILLFFFPLFKRGKIKGEKNNQSQDFKSCLSARSENQYFQLLVKSGLNIFYNRSTNSEAFCALQWSECLYHPPSFNVPLV